MSRGLTAVLEAWLTARLMRSPTFNHSVHNIHKRYQRLRYGTPPEEMGGTNIDRVDKRGGRGFLAYLTDEIKDQLRLKGGPPRPPLSK